MCSPGWRWLLRRHTHLHRRIEFQPIRAGYVPEATSAQTVGVGRGRRIGADDGNRTRVLSLGSCFSWMRSAGTSVRSASANLRSGYLCPRWFVVSTKHPPWQLAARKRQRYRWRLLTRVTQSAVRTVWRRGGDAKPFPVGSPAPLVDVKPTFACDFGRCPH
jgi:hypothetical protein